MSCLQEIIEKRSSEELVYDVDLYAELAPSETVDEVLAVSIDEPEVDEEELDSNSVPLTAADPGDWAINDEAIVYRDGRSVPAGKVLQGLFTGGAGYDGVTHTVRIEYATNLQPVREATFQIRIRDAIA